MVTEMKKYTRLAVLAVLLALLLPAALSCRNGGDAAQTGTTDTAEPVESTADITEATEPETDAPETAPLSPAAHFEGENVRLSVTQVGTIDRDGDWRIIQGGTTDGKFIYVIVHNGDKTAAAKSRLRKYDMSTMEQVAETDPLQVCHGNDIAYKPAENELYVVHCYPNGDTVSVFDADTLAFKRQIKLPVSIYCMSYDETLDCFWVGINGGDTFAKLTSDFKFVKRYMSRMHGYVTQGMDCDDRYLYFVRYKKNCVIVYEKNGNFVGEYDLAFSGEPENISHVGDTFYITGNGMISKGGLIYKVEVKN